MPQTAKNAIDSLKNILARFGITDDSRLDDDWLLYKYNQVRAEFIIAQYARTGVIDFAWLSEGTHLTFHRVTSGDTVDQSCCWDISKSTIPQTITLQSKDGNLDLGVYSLISLCGKTTYYPSRMSQWRYTPEGHTNKLFAKYARVNTTIYVDRVVEKLRFIGILLDPAEGFLINSAPVTTLVPGIKYYVLGNQIVYEGVVLEPCTSFTAVTDTTYQGSGSVYLYSQFVAYKDTDPYPAGGEMMRQIELEILTKEFNIERQQVADIRNDSKDDASKAL